MEVYEFTREGRSRILQVLTEELVPTSPHDIIREARRDNGVPSPSNLIKEAVA
jgi:hypothetical protein